MLEEAETLNAILQKVQSSSHLLPDELNTLAGSFSPVQSTLDQSKSYLILSLLLQHARKSTTPRQGSQIDLTRAFEAIIADKLSETNEASLVAGISFLTALFRVDAEIASGLFTVEGRLEDIMDSVEISPSRQLSLAVAKLMAEASGHNKSRDIVTKNAKRWLEHQSNQADEALRVSSAVALVKLWQASSQNQAEGDQLEVPTTITMDKLNDLMKKVVISKTDQSAILEAVEGLAYLSTEPSIKETLSKDSAFLQQLFSLIPVRKHALNDPPARINSPLFYGVVAIITNLSRYRPKLSEEQKQLQKLKKMAKVPQKTPLEPKDESVLDDNDHVKVRIHRLLDANVLSILSTIPTLTDSQAIHLCVGKTLLSIIEEKENRGKVLQTGGGKALQLIIKQLMPRSGASNQSITAAAIPLEPIQALAKLSITSSPLHVYGPDVGAIYDILRPLSLLIQHQTAIQLQQFEGMMALTNLASHSQDVASRISALDGLLSRVELILLDEHVLLRRAATELICNLISGSDKAFERYGSTKSKLQIVLALSDVDDIPTRLAASGALATLTGSSDTCHALLELQVEKGRFLPIMTELLLPVAASNSDGVGKENLGLIHRAVVCVRNFMAQNPASKLKEVDAKDSEGFSRLRNTLLDLLKRRESLKIDGAILQPLAEAIRIMVDLTK